MQEKKKHRPSPLSKNPHVRRSESEIKGIIEEIASGSIGIRAACMKHGLNRNTLKLWMTKLSVRTLRDNRKQVILSSMEEDQREKDNKNEVKRLSKALEYAKLRILSLETMIKVTEEDLQIKIREKPGTKQSKE
ncbi:MAG TPA: hypothetical protein VGN00_12910 [Puia sp.]|jgi:hypothetical protein